MQRQTIYKPEPIGLDLVVDTIQRKLITTFPQTTTGFPLCERIETQRNKDSIYSYTTEPFILNSNGEYINALPDNKDVISFYFDLASNIEYVYKDTNRFTKQASLLIVFFVNLKTALRKEYASKERLIIEIEKAVNNCGVDLRISRQITELDYIFKDYYNITKQMNTNITTFPFYLFALEIDIKYRNNKIC